MHILTRSRFHFTFGFLKRIWESVQSESKGGQAGSSVPIQVFRVLWKSCWIPIWEDLGFGFEWQEWQNKRVERVWKAHFCACEVLWRLFGSSGVRSVYPSKLVITVLGDRCPQHLPNRTRYGRVRIWSSIIYQEWSRGVWFWNSPPTLYEICANSCQTFPIRGQPVDIFSYRVSQSWVWAK